jgi:hypothetical protein
MAPGIAKKDIETVVSIARHLQAANKQELELLVSQYIPELPQETEIPDVAMYELAEALHISSEYMSQAMQLHSGSIDETQSLLDMIGASPGPSLIFGWQGRISERCLYKIKQALTPLGNGFSITSREHNYSPGNQNIFVHQIGYDPLEHASEWKKFWADTSYRLFGKINFACAQTELDMGVTLTAHTERALPLISGIGRPLVEDMSYVKSCDVVYDPHKEGEEIFVEEFSRVVKSGDPF